MFPTNESGGYDSFATLLLQRDPLDTFYSLASASDRRAA
jgi:hypothetical protein